MPRVLARKLPYAARSLGRNVQTMDERAVYENMTAVGVVEVMAYLIGRYGWNEDDAHNSVTGDRGLSVCGAFNRACGSKTIWKETEPTPEQAKAWLALFTADLLESNLHRDWASRRRTKDEIVEALECVKVHLRRVACACWN